MGDKVKLLLEGGHTTTIEGLTTQEVEHYLTDLRQTDDEFAYLQSDFIPDNGLIIDPNKVVAIVAVIR